MDSDERKRAPVWNREIDPLSLMLVVFTVVAFVVIWVISSQSPAAPLGGGSPGPTLAATDTMRSTPSPSSAAHTKGTVASSSKSGTETKQTADEPSNESEHASNSESLEYKLASINSGGLVAADDPDVARFRALLDRMQGKTSSSESQIANELVEGHTLLAENGHSESLLSVAEHVAEVTDNMTYDQVKFSDVVASYVVLRGKGAD